jgi:phage terminase large subunit
MRKRGFSIVPASKGSGSIQDGIEFLRSYDIVAHERCRHLIDELIHYSWAVDRLTNQIQPRLEDKNNHVIDALRYALEGARKARVVDTRFASSGPRIMRPDMGFASNQYSDGPNWIRDRYRGRGLPY